MAEGNTSALESFTKNVLARVGTSVGAAGGIATAVFNLTRDVALTSAGVVLTLALVGSAFVLLWRTSKMEGEKKISVPHFGRNYRLIAAIVMGLAIIGVVPFSLQIVNVLNQRQEREKQIEAIPFLTLTPKPALTPTPTLAPEAQRTATIQSALAQAAAWPIVFSDGFQSNSNLWNVQPLSTNDGSYTRSIANGKLHIEAQTSSNTNVRVSPITQTGRMREFGDFDVSVDIQTTGSKAAIYGLQFRILGANFYYVTMGNDQSFLFNVVADGKSSTLVNFTQLAAIKPEGVNRLVVIGRGAQFIVLINGQFVTQVEDASVRTGRIGMWAQLLKSNEQATFDFANFEVRAP